VFPYFVRFVLLSHLHYRMPKWEEFKVYGFTLCNKNHKLEPSKQSDLHAQTWMHEKKKNPYYNFLHNTKTMNSKLELYVFPKHFLCDFMVCWYCWHFSLLVQTLLAWIKCSRPTLCGSCSRFAIIQILGYPKYSMVLLMFKCKWETISSAKKLCL
jgi:hypothetical protein